MRARSVVPAGEWDRSREVDRVDAVYDDRHRRRVVFYTASGGEVLLDLAQARHMHDGDGLVLDDDEGFVRVCATPERLLEITADDPHHLLRLAWHLGNRHLPTALEDDRLMIREDHVIADMVRGLGGKVREVEAAFDPETGAYHEH